MHFAFLWDNDQTLGFYKNIVLFSLSHNNAKFCNTLHRICLEMVWQAPFSRMTCLNIATKILPLSIAHFFSLLIILTIIKNISRRICLWLIADKIKINSWYVCFWPLSPNSLRDLQKTCLNLIILKCLSIVINSWNYVRKF